MEDLINIAIGEVGELLLDRLQKANGDMDPVVAYMPLLRPEPHRPKRTAGLRLHIIRASRVPPAPFSNKFHQITTKFDTMINKSDCGEGILRQTEHDRSATLLRNEPTKPPLAFVDPLQILLTHLRVCLHHRHC